MKKKGKILLTVAISLAVLAGVIALLLIPGEERYLDDGGSHFRKSFLRMEAEWVYLTNNGSQAVKRVYWFPETMKSVDQLKAEAQASLKPQFIATILEIHGNTVLVELSEASAKAYGIDKLSFGTADLEDIAAKVGTRVAVIFDGMIMESYPGQIRAISWRDITPK